MAIETKYMQHLMKFLPTDDSTPFQRDGDKLYIRYDHIEIDLEETGTVQRYYWRGDLIITQNSPGTTIGDTLNLSGFDARMEVKLL